MTETKLKYIYKVGYVDGVPCIERHESDGWVNAHEFTKYSDAYAEWKEQCESLIKDTQKALAFTPAKSKDVYWEENWQEIGTAKRQPSVNGSEKDG